MIENKHMKDVLETNEQLKETIKELELENAKLKDVLETNEQLKETIKELELENAKHIGDGEWDIRDITYRHGKFRLEEWGNSHQFYDGDKALEDEEVVSLLFENEQLKSAYMEMEDYLGRLEERIIELEKENQEMDKK